MKRMLLLALLCAALGLGGWARAEGVDLDATVWMSPDNGYDCYFHATGKCRLAAEDEAEYERVFAEVSGKTPCPVCWEDETQYGGVEAWERGGTLVIRVPDHYIEERMFGVSAPAAVPEALIEENDNRLDDVARLVHGNAYADWLESAVPGMEQRFTAVIPDLDSDKTDALLMSRRHLGAAWYLVVRPNEDERKAMQADGEWTMPVIFYSADLRVASYDAGVTIAQGDRSERWAGTLNLRPEKSGGEIVFQSEDGAIDEWPYVVRDGDINTAVFRRAYDEYGTTRARLQYCKQWTRLEGYVDGKSVLFIWVMTDGELQALNEKYVVSLYSEGEGADGGPADAAQLAADYQPVSRVTLADGSEAAMDQAEYPVGTGFVSYTLNRPQGGIAWYDNEVELEQLTDGQWKGVATYIAAYADWDEEREHSGYFCDHVTLTVPLEGVGALEEGLYRLQISGRDAGGTTWHCSLEFRVDADAPTAARGEARTFGGEGLIVLPHTPPHADAATYNSCVDNTRAYEGGNRTVLLAGDTVFDLRGVDESWGWGIWSAYNLFAYPEGHPEQARQILANFDHSEVTLYDAGDGLLLFSTSEDELYRCDYDGGNLEKLAGQKELGTGYGQDLLPVGGGIYVISSGVWHAPLTDFRPQQVYKPMAGVRNDLRGGGFAVYAEGKLILAEESGIFALDTDRFNPDGTLPADWLTDEYDPESGANGLGYIVLNGRLYYWSEREKAMMSVKLDGTDRKEVSKERYWFNSVTPGGIVLALSGSEPGWFGDERTAAAFYFPPDPENPAFDPDHSQKRDIEPNTYYYVLGNYVYCRDEDGNETRMPLAELSGE